MGQGSIARPRPRARSAIAVVALVTAAVAGVAPSAGAGADLPEPGESLLFVVSGTATVRDDAVVIRDPSVEWYTDHPTRRAGSMSAQDLVDGWADWGFDQDPPNAALTADGVDVVAELGEPRLRRSVLRFDATAIRGDLGQGRIGDAWLFVDPSAETFTVDVTNNTLTFQTISIVQVAGSSSGATVAPVVWMSEAVDPGVPQQFDWRNEYAFAWAEGTSIVPGTSFSFQDTVATSPGSMITLSTSSSGTAFGSPEPSATAGVLEILVDGSVGAGQVVVGIEVSDAPALVAQVPPGGNVTIDPDGTRYFIFFGGEVQVGQVVDPAIVEAEGYELQFGDSNQLQVTLNSDGTWSPGSGSG